MKKPTPTQANYLKLLATQVDGFDPYVVYTYHLEGVSRKTTKRACRDATIPELENFHLITAKTCFDNGWIMMINKSKIVDEGTRKKTARFEKCEYTWGVFYEISPAGREVLAALKPEDFIVPAYNMDGFTESEITEALKDKYDNEQGDGWIFISQVRNHTGYYGGREQYIDGYAINLWPGRRIQAIAFEIKVSRADFLKEMKDPQKRQCAMDHSNEFYFVVPVGMLKVEEIPEDCGLITVKRMDTLIGLHTEKKAPIRPRFEMDWSFFTGIARKLRRGSK